MAIQFQRVSGFGSVLSALPVPACVAFRSSSDPRSRATHSSRLHIQKTEYERYEHHAPTSIEKTPCAHWIYVALADATFAS